MKQAESNQSPSKTSYMTRMKKTKLEKKWKIKVVF
jgi:uncharacterized protein YdcH (DUF465 family)